jgi:hypothetical protein
MWLSFRSAQRHLGKQPEMPIKASWPWALSALEVKLPSSLCCTVTGRTLFHQELSNECQARCPDRSVSCVWSRLACVVARGSGYGPTSLHLPCSMCCSGPLSWAEGWSGGYPSSGCRRERLLMLLGHVARVVGTTKQTFEVRNHEQNWMKGALTSPGHLPQWRLLCDRLEGAERGTGWDPRAGPDWAGVWWGNPVTGWTLVG